MEINYANFVTEIIKCIEPLMNPDEDKLVAFSGGCSNKMRNLQDYACIRGSDAVFFLNCAQLLKADPGVNEMCFQPEYTIANPKTPKYTHSCYAKNLRRWMSGTISRKRKCRAEFVLLAACWCFGFGQDELKVKPEIDVCRRQIRKVCQMITGNDYKNVDQNNIAMFVKILWEASDKAYRTVKCTAADLSLTTGLE